MTTALNLAQPRVAVAHATSASALLAWALTLAMPLGVFSALSTRLSHDAAMLLALMVGAAIHWVFRVVPDFVIGLLLLWLCVLLGLAPAGLAFSGFTLLWRLQQHDCSNATRGCQPWYCLPWYCLPRGCRH